MRPVVIIVALVLVAVGYWWYVTPRGPALSTYGVDFGKVSMYCPTGVVKVGSASYGNPLCAPIDATSSVAGQCNGKANCTFNVLPSSMNMPDGTLGMLPPNDPCPGNQKTLTINYNCV